MRAGLGALRLTPHEFWQLTPLELQMMLGADGASDSSLSRHNFRNLMLRFPDVGTGRIEGRGDTQEEFSDG